MRIKAMVAVAAVSISGAPATGAVADTHTPTKVTIKGSNGDYHGKVKSADPACEDGRKVTVFMLTGNHPNPGVDQKIGSDTAEANGSHAEWSIGNSGYKDGELYARVRKKPECGGEISKVLSG